MDPNLTTCIKIPLRVQTVLVWKNTLEVDSETSGVWVFWRGWGVTIEGSLWKDMKLGAEYVEGEERNPQW